eukprot:6187462-Pleurochrysis_carterae.AAC.2
MSLFASTGSHYSNGTYGAGSSGSCFSSCVRLERLLERHSNLVAARCSPPTMGKWLPQDILTPATT